MDVKLRGVPPFWVNYEGDSGSGIKLVSPAAFALGKKVVKWVLNLAQVPERRFRFCVSILETTVYFLAGIIYTECE